MATELGTTRPAFFNYSVNTGSPTQPPDQQDVPAGSPIGAAIGGALGGFAAILLCTLALPARLAPLEGS